MSKQRFWPSIFLLAVFVIFFISPVLAQEPVVSQFFDVNVLPEYDTPGKVLTTLSGIIQNQGNTDLKELTFTIPSDSSIDKVAFVRETGELTYLPFNLENKGNQAVLKITLNPVVKPNKQLNIFIQFHFGNLILTEKKVDAILNFPFTAKRLNVKILEPQGAGLFKTNLQNDLLTQTHEGLKLHSFTLENKNVLSFNFSYSRTDTTPVMPKEDYQSALSRLQEQAKAEQKTNAAKSSNNSSLIAGIIIIFVILAIGGTIAYYLVRSKSESQREAVNKKVLRKMLIEGKITEEEYRRLLKKSLEQEG
ncbi:hypothetical protein [Carboxydothermus pertinax]|uniref:SHOCT domain-containing protein n=1 Tax=Carboxydothermus pertinax TaxID=870242 RepID=A0A1L8CXI1_9THEO|nr:hypothetical protein [Carboxydothermus pertinax]GAV23632.1 hypothetical protein cpu_21420 [Carboxydothermus pertinax]